MDSRKSLTPLRSQNLTGSWSQLYKSGDLYLDLNMRNSGLEAVLMGHLVTDPSAPIPDRATARLKGDSDVEYQAHITSTGSFRLPIARSGIYRLELDLHNHLISIDSLEL